MARMVTIEFTQDTVDEEGNPKRYSGQRARVDSDSAKSFVDVKKVAKRIERDVPVEKKAAATPVPVKAPEPITPVEGDAPA